MVCDSAVCPTLRLLPKRPITYAVLDPYAHTVLFFFFFLNDPPPPEIHPLPLHAPLPIWSPPPAKRAPPRQETSWPTYLGTPRHDACAAESLNADPRPLWHTDVGRAVRGSPAMGETVLVVGVADRVVALVDRATGQSLWRSRVAGTIHGGPLLDGDRVYVATEATPDARVYALRLRDGRTIWSTKTESIVAPLALDGDTLYAATEAGTALPLGNHGGRDR